MFAIAGSLCERRRDTGVVLPDAPTSRNRVYGHMFDDDLDEVAQRLDSLATRNERGMSDAAGAGDGSARGVTCANRWWAGKGSNLRPRDYESRQGRPAHSPRTRSSGRSGGSSEPSRRVPSGFAQIQGHAKGRTSRREWVSACAYSRTSCRQPSRSDLEFDALVALLASADGLAAMPSWRTSRAKVVHACCQAARAAGSVGLAPKG